MSSIQMEERTYRLIGVTPLLGSQPAKEDIRTAYILKNAPKDAKDTNDCLKDREEEGLTVFLRDPDEDGAIFVSAHQIKSFIRHTMNDLKLQNGIKQAKDKVLKFLFIDEQRLHITRNGERIYDEDSVCERPGRVNTGMSEQSVLMASEQINDPWEITFTLKLLKNEGTASSKAITWEAIEQTLDYGEWKGIGQWRNSSMYGKFIWDRIK